MKLQKILSNNTFLVNACICVVVLLMLCYLGTSYPVKETYSVSMATCEGNLMITEDGNEVCMDYAGNLYAKDILYGEYTWNETLTDVSDYKNSIDLNINFSSNGKSYYSLKVMKKNLKYGLYYNDYLAYSFENIQNNYVDVWTNVGDRTINFTDYNSVYVDADTYEWFHANATPIMKCYYNENNNEFVWTNIQTMGQVYSGYNTKEKCDNARAIKLVDSNKGLFSYGDYYEKLILDGTKGTEVSLGSLLLGKAYSMHRDGYNFLRWDTSENGTGVKYEPDSKFTLSSNLVLYAQWDPVKYTVKFDKNAEDATGTMEDQQFIYDKAQKLNLNQFTRDGYKFVGWKFDSRDFQDNEEVNNLVASNTTITLKAQWLELDKYLISYDVNTNDLVSNVPASANKTVGEEFLIDSKIPVREGYIFDGWYTNRECTGTKYMPGDSYSTDANLYLYAKWLTPFEFDSSYTVNEKDGYVIVPIPISRGDFEKKVTLIDGFTLEVESMVATDMLFTGGKIVIKSSNGVYKEYTTVVLGDVDGSGDLGYRDYVLVYNHIRKSKNSSLALNLLEGERLVAGDISLANSIDYRDYVLIYNEIKK